MDLVKIIKEIPEKFIETINFLKDFFYDLLLLTFKPRKFAEQFTSSNTSRKPFNKSFLFLFTLVFFLELIIKIIDRILDAQTSIDDVGLSTALQSENLWNVSWQLILYDTVPIVLTLFAIGWLLGRLYSKDKDAQNEIRAIYPYALWRSVVLLLLFEFISAVCIGIIVLLIGFFYNDIFVWIFLDFTTILAFLGVISIILTLKHIGKFISQLLSREVNFSVKNFRNLVFRFGIICSLIIPIWWSSVSLSSPASKIAIKSEPVFADSLGVYTINLDLRNISNQPLFTSDKGNILSWWDDENPVYRSDFFSSTRVANGKIYLKTSEDQELSDRFQRFTYVGGDSKAKLTPKSYGVFDFMGGPEMQMPTKKEYNQAELSLQEILENRKKGRIEITIAVSTKGGRLFSRTITVFNSD